MLALLIAAAFAAAPDAPAADPSASDPTVTMPDRAPRGTVLDVVHLTDGQTLEGSVVSADDTSVVLRLGDGRELAIPRAVVRRIDQRTAAVGTIGTHGIDPNRGRYFYSPAAFPLGKGNVTLAQRALVLTTAAVGVLPGVDLEAGTILPTLFTRQGQVGIIGGKGGVRVSDRVRVGAGAQGFIVAETAGGFAFGTVTIGEPDLHGSINVGVAVDFLAPQDPIGVSTLSLSRRLNKKIAFVTETWVLWFTSGEGPWSHPLFVVPSGGVRVFGSGFSVDVGLVPVVTGEREIPVVPIPWVSFVGNLRTARTERAPM